MGRGVCSPGGTADVGDRGDEEDAAEGNECGIQHMARSSSITCRAGEVA